MSASAISTAIVELLDLGQNEYFINKATDGTTPTAYTKNYRVLAEAGTAESLDLGDVSTVTLLVIRAIDYDLDIDLDFVSEFDADLTVKAGEPAAIIPNPAGTIKVENNGEGETPAYEFLCIGTT
jgi:hypothetical protein